MTINRKQVKIHIQERIHSIIVDKELSPESASLKIAEVIDTANEIAFRYRIICQSVGIENTSECMEEYNVAMSKLNINQF